MTDAETEYAGFISYRRVAPDQQWATWLHRQLETFRLPKGLVQSHSLESNKLGPFFLDDAETAAEDDLPAKLRESLGQSESVVVVCSPRTCDALWVNAEIEYYAKTHPHRPIILMLIEGEPTEAFPRSLFKDNPQDDLSLLDSKQPLAADVRQNKWWQFERRRLAVTKVAAAILKQRIGVEFDQLWQRERRRFALWRSR